MRLFLWSKIYTQIREQQGKRRENSLKKWGVEHPFQAEEVKSKIEKSIAGTAVRFGTELSKNAIKKMYGVDNVSQLDFIKDKKAESYNNNYTSKGIYPKYGPVSKINLKWKEILEEETGLKWKLEERFADVGNIDLYCENNNDTIAVEINPTVTHNSYKNVISCTRKGCQEFPCPNHAKSRYYHFNKTKKLHELYNQSLISVFDWMEKEKVVQFIKSKLKLDSNKIYAKKAKIIEISQKDANKFLKKYHMMGERRNQTHCYGLEYNNKLIQVQTFAPLGQRQDFFEPAVSQRNLIGQLLAVLAK